MNKKILIPTLGLAALLGATLFGVSSASADDETTAHPMIQALAERFGLNEDEVETFMGERMQERHQEMQQSKEDRLEKAVSDGVITEDHRNALVEKWNQMHEERSQEREEHREEMQAWMESQGIDHEALMEYSGFKEGGIGKMGKGMMRGQ
jgi:hypothetical protein